MQVFPQDKFILRDIVRPRTWQDWSSNVGVWTPKRYCEDICKTLCTVPLCKWSEHGSWHTTEKEEYRLHPSFQPLMKLRRSLRTSETNRENEAMHIWINTKLPNTEFTVLYNIFIPQTEESTTQNPPPYLELITDGTSGLLKVYCLQYVPAPICNQLKYSSCSSIVLSR